MVKNCGFFQILRITDLILPELDPSSASSGKYVLIALICGYVEAGSCGEEREDADSNAEGRSCGNRFDGGVSGENSCIVVVMVEGRGRSYDEHTHLR